MTEAPKRSKFYRELLCSKCFEEWEALHKKGQDYLKKLRARGDFLD